MPPLYCYYGDDFTGSTDVLEQLAAHGVEAALFLKPPAREQAARFAHCQAIGFAGNARSRTPEWMSEHLPAIFDRMRELCPRIIHYKVCSTFDSAPLRGSIGRALEIGRRVFATSTVPIVVGAPHLGRFVVFGELFAAQGDRVYRIDRHPTMAHHPATPMHEAELSRHLAKQTNLPIGIVDLRAFHSNRVAEEFRASAEAGAGGVVFDGLDAAMLERTGELIWSLGDGSQPVFSIGSSGLTAGVLAHWRKAGFCEEDPKPAASLASHAMRPGRDRILVLSGSCSLATARQIQWSKAHGYTSIELDAEALSAGDPQARASAVRLAAASLKSEQNTVLYTAMGTPAGAACGDELGASLGGLLLDLIRQTGVRRVVLCGGDTSSHAVQELDLIALTFAAPLVPGAPLCRAHAEPSTGLDGLELVLKGGQIGPEDFFEIARQGKRA